MIYLISNNKQADLTVITEPSLLVMFNGHFNLEKAPPNVPIDLFVYMNSQGTIYKEKIEQNRNKFRKIYIIDGHKVKDYIKGDINIDSSNVPYPKGKIPSAGFIAINYFNEMYFSKPVLCGWAFQGWEGHDWEYEKAWINKNHYRIIGI